jgi:hypothetical protein
MSVIYTFQYKCRRCEGVIRNPQTSEENTLSRLIALTDHGPHERALGINVELLDIHRCDDDGIGIADLIGAEESNA